MPQDEMTLRLVGMRRFTVVMCLSAVLAACGGDPNMIRSTAPVTTVNIGEPGEVSAMSLAQAMLRAGFSRSEILEFGPGIRRSLAESGGAQARREGQLFALFSYREGKLYVTSARTGTFVVDA